MTTVTIFKALADETRLRLLRILLHHELSVNELVSILKMGQSRISRHLRVLSDAGTASGSSTRRIRTLTSRNF